jgi:hypothetical protein
MATLDRCVAHPSIQPDTVEALVQNVRGLMTDEEQRASSLVSRGSGLAGFAGVILALAGAAATSVNGYHGTLGIVLTGLSAAALVSLAMAVVAVVVGLLLPPVGVWSAPESWRSTRHGGLPRKIASSSRRPFLAIWSIRSSTSGGRTDVERRLCGSATRFSASGWPSLRWSLLP